MDAIKVLDAMNEFVKAQESINENASEDQTLQALKAKLAELDVRGKPAKIVINYDDDAQSPREWENLGVMVCWHRRYNLGDKDAIEWLKGDIRASKAYKDKWEVEYDFTSPGDLYAMAAACDFLIMPLYLFDHSGISMSTSDFGDRWDSGQVGFIYATKDAIRNEYGVKKVTRKIMDQAKMRLHSEVDVYDTYLTGNVHGFELRDEFGDVIDSCWGFYGNSDSKDDLVENGMSDHLPENWRDLPIVQAHQM